MPSGRTHGAITVMAATGIFVFGMVQDANPQPILATSFGCFMGLFLSPDLDLTMDVLPKARVRRWFGRPLWALWYGFWYPYSWAIPHRSWVSHAPLVSTLIRVFYMFVPVMILDIFSSSFSVLDLFVTSAGLGPVVSFVFLGLVVSDVLHWVMDILF